MATANQIINKAKSYLGYKESPPNSNKCVFNRDYYGWDAPYYWCCTFVWDIFRMCGASKLFYNGNKTASCTTVLNWGRNNGLTVPNDKGQCGDLILFDWDNSGDADHIGFIVAKADPHPGRQRQKGAGRASAISALFKGRGSPDGQGQLASLSFC